MTAPHVHRFARRAGYRWNFCADCWAIAPADAVPCSPRIGFDLRDPTPAETEIEARYLDDERAAIRAHGGG